jgi:hypothetical protein
LRAIGLLCGGATIIVGGFCAAAQADLLRADEFAKRVMIAFVTGFIALNSIMIDMSRQVRPYPVMILSYAVAVLALLRLARNAGSTPLSVCWVVLFFATEALMLWLHSLGPLYAVAMTLALATIVLSRQLRSRDWLLLALGQSLVAILYLPAFVILIVQARTWVHSTWLTFQPAEVPAQTALLLASGNWGAVACCGVLLLVALVLMAREGPRAGRMALALLLLTGLPILLSILISLFVSPVFLVRTLSPTVIPFTLLIAAAAAAVRQRIFVVASLLLILLISAGTDRLIAALPRGEDWYAAATWLTPRVSKADRVWAYPNEAALPLTYALEDRGQTLTIRQIPAPVPALGVAGGHPTGTPGVVALDRVQIEWLLDQPEAKQPTTIWLVGLATERLDPEDLIGRALRRTRDPITSYRVNEISIVGWRLRE